MNTRFGLVLAAALVGLSPALTVGTGPARAVNDCDFEFATSNPDVYKPQITGRGLAGCDAPPDSHRVQLALEYEQGGRWVVASVKTDNTIPPPFRAGGHRYEVSAACYAGTWRMAVAIRGTIQGHTFQFEDHSGTVDIPASVCHPRF